MPSPNHVLSWLLGEWRFKREIPGQATMTGRASFTAHSPDRAEYHETASVQMRDGQVFQGEQRYIYEQAAEGVAVYFHPSGLSTEAGKLFHNLRFTSDWDGKLRATAEHLCKADVYLSEYVISPAGDTESLTVEHDVRGPQKSYRLHTVYRRHKQAGLNRSDGYTSA